jgi:MoaA/NifB/PqqE/SkfB family radical SAM enzyme
VKYPVKNFVKCCINSFVLRKPTPLLLSFEITQKCNAKCSFCGYWRLKNPSLGLPLKDIMKMLDNGYDLGCVLLGITGGEPLLRKDLPEVFKHAKNIGFSTLLLTNGYLLPKRIHELHPYLDSMNVSVDFPDSRHDKNRGLNNLLERTIVGIRLARKYGVSTNMNCVVTAEHSLEDIRKLLFMAKDLDSTVSFEPVFLTPNPEGSILGTMSKNDADLVKIENWNLVERAADMLLFYKKHGFGKTILNTEAFLKLVKERTNFTCFPFSLQLGIAYVGDVTSMCVTGLPKGYLGNALTQSLKEIWYSERAQKLRDEYRHCRLAQSYGCYLFCVAEPSLPFTNSKVFYEYVKKAI